jgi:hypothetical protein
MVGKQPLHVLDNPSGYVSPVVYPSKPVSVQGRTAGDVTSAVKVNAQNSTPTATAAPPRGLRIPGTGVRLPLGWRGVWPVGFSYLGVRGQG